MIAPPGRVTGVLDRRYPSVREKRFWKACIRHRARSAEAAGAAGLDQLTEILPGRGTIMQD